MSLVCIFLYNYCVEGWIPEEVELLGDSSPYADFSDINNEYIHIVGRMGLRWTNKLWIRKRSL